MKIIFKTTMVVGLILVNSVCEAQILNPRRIGQKVADRAAQRAEQRAEDKINEGVDKGVDKAIDSIFGIGKNTKTETQSTGTSDTQNIPSGSSDADLSQEQAMGMLSGLLGGMGNTPPPAASYDFSSSYTMDIKSKNKDGNFNMKNKYYFTKSGDYMASKMISGSNPEMTNATQGLQAVIIDFDKECMYTFMETQGKKSMIGMSMKAAGEMAEKIVNKNETEENTNFVKTGETKTIAGYSCDAYLLTQGKEKSTIWISKNRVPVVSTYYKSFQKMTSSASTSMFKVDNKSNAEMMKFAQEGRAMLGMDMKDQNGEEMHMEVTEIKESDSYSLKTAGYENMMDFNKIMQDAQKQQKSEE